MDKIIIKNERKTLKIILFIVISSLILFGIEMIGYALLSVWFGQIWYNGNLGNYTSPYALGDRYSNQWYDSILNLQTPLDRIMPWWEWIFPYYIQYAITWPIIFPLVIFLLTPRCDFKINYIRYFLNGFIMYIVSTIIYIIIPTTCRPGQFESLLDNNNVFTFWIKTSLINDTAQLNVFGACPSFHNYWASIFILISLWKGIKIYWRILLAVLGIMITLATWTLHQHNVIDTIVTYSMTFTIAYIINTMKIDEKLYKWLVKKNILYFDTK